jgi:perosamine synthetase
MEYSIDLLTVAPSSSLRVVMQRLAETGTRVLFVVEAGTLVGSVSDGDVRRALLSGVTLEDSVTEAMNRTLSAARVTDDIVAVHEQFRQGVTLLPIIGEDGHLLRVIDRPSDLFVPIAEPNLSPIESSLVNECLRSNWISSAGHFVSDFERAFESYLGGGTAVAVSNGTLGLVLALHSLGVGPGDEVIVPDLTFGATANAVTQVGATAVIVDIDPLTWGLSAESVMAGLSPRTKAVIPVHLYGHPVDMEPIVRLCRSRGVAVIEDCAEAIGSRVRGEHVGLAGDAGVFSFFANKTITTGEGGMVVFRDSAVAARSRKARSHGFDPVRRYWHDEWGSNFRLTNLQAALGVGQMTRVEELVGRKREIAKEYRRHLEALAPLGLELPSEQPWATSSFWLYTVLCPESVDRDEIGRVLTDSGIETRPIFYPLSIQPAFSGALQRLPREPQSHRISRRGLSLPSGTTMTSRSLEYVADLFRRAIIGACAP